MNLSGEGVHSIPLAGGAAHTSGLLGCLALAGTEDQEGWGGLRRAAARKGIQWWHSGPLEVVKSNCDVARGGCDPSVFFTDLLWRQGVGEEKGGRLRGLLGALRGWRGYPWNRVCSGFWIIPVN